jgi:sulfur carrier protein ThiS
MALTEEITIQLNGATTHVRVGCTVAELVAATLPNARAFAVEVNRDGDSVEIVTLVGGG